MNRLPARLDHCADRRRRLSAELGRINRFLNVEFLDRVHRRSRHQVVEILVRHRHAVQVVHVVPGPLPGHQHGRAGLCQSRSARSARSFEHVAAEQRQVHKLPPVQRKVDDSLIPDYFAQFRVRTVHQRYGFLNRDHLGLIPDHQHQVHAFLPPHLQHDALPYPGPEIGEFGLDRILAHRKRRGNIASIARGRHFTRVHGPPLGERQFHIRQGRACRISDNAGDLACTGLSAS